MQWTMSNKLCEAPVKMQIRCERRTPPRRSANLWLDMVKPRLFKVESVLEVSLLSAISKRRYGMEVEGNSVVLHDRVKSNFIWCERLWL